jgi:hypothetical protein
MRKYELHALVVSLVTAWLLRALLRLTTLLQLNNPYARLVAEPN